MPLPTFLQFGRGARLSALIYFAELNFDRMTHARRPVTTPAGPAVVHKLRGQSVALGREQHIGLKQCLVIWGGTPKPFATVTITQTRAAPSSRRSVARA